MYLASTRKNGRLHFDIRHSLPHDDYFIPITVFTLGPQPDQHFSVFDGRTILFSQPLLDAVSQYEPINPDDLLEHLLLRFFPLDIQQRFTDFTPPRRIRVGPIKEEERQAIAHQVHLFDRRRLFYLRYGAVDQSRLSRMHEKACRPLLNQSRDERECYFFAEERSLEPGMYTQYIFAIFNLQRFFTESYATWMPEALARDALGEYLEQEICVLNADSTFTRGLKQIDKFLHPHLQRYLIWFFDYQASVRSFAEDYVRAFQERHRTFKWPEQNKQRSKTEISEIFAMPYEDLRAMSKAQLTRLYRQKAMALHPDLGGDHEAFIQLTEAYKYLQK